ncbi:MAG: aminoglycoside phosphotransferase, partial [Gaiellaceae bacterium]
MEANAGFANEIQTLLVADGRGFARLLRHDEARTSSRRAPRGPRLAGFITVTWEALDHPCSERVVAQALAFADIRSAAFDPSAAVLIHGDAHSANTLRDLRGEASAGQPRFKFVDPDGLVAGRAYDLAIPMREWAAELLAGDALELGRRRCALLSRLTGVDPVAIWEWGSSGGCPP